MFSSYNTLTHFSQIQYTTLQCDNLFLPFLSLEVSLYLNTRVQSEHLDLSTLEQELLLDPILVSAMESQPLLARNV